MNATINAVAKLNANGWDKTQFQKSGGYLSYNGKFVARFKMPAADFQKFLMANFTPGEYFARLDAKEAPLEILQTKGYVLPHIRKWAAQGRQSAIDYIARVMEKVAK